VVRRYEGVTDPQKVAQLAEEGFVPIISEMPGFVAHYLVDAGDGVMRRTCAAQASRAASIIRCYPSTSTARSVRQALEVWPKSQASAGEPSGEQRANRYL
jgi:hypothetical protein